MTPPIKIGFVLLSPSAQPLPSTRIAILNMFPFLRAAGFDPQVAFEPARATETPDLAGLAPRLLAAGYEIIVFQKVHGPSVEALVGKLQVAGVKTVYCVCDLIDDVLAAATDATVVVTDFLKRLYPPAVQHKIRVVHDGIEHPELCKVQWSTHRGSPGHPLRALLVTSAQLDSLPFVGMLPDWLEVTILGDYPEHRRAPGFRSALGALRARSCMRDRLDYLRFLADRRIHCVRWSEVGVREALLAADIAIIPIDTRQPQAPDELVAPWRVKSENRLTMKMAAALPVIATPIPSYEEVIEHGVNGFFARDRNEWHACLEALRDPTRRRTVGERARTSVIGKYSMQAQAAALVPVLHSLLSAERRLSATTPYAVACDEYTAAPSAHSPCPSPL
jgi:hypothetical protein